MTIFNRFSKITSKKSCINSKNLKNSTAISPVSFPKDETSLGLMALEQRILLDAAGVATGAEAAADNVAQQQANSAAAKFSEDYKNSQTEQPADTDAAQTPKQEQDIDINLIRQIGGNQSEPLRVLMDDDNQANAATSEQFVLSLTQNSDYTNTELFSLDYSDTDYITLNDARNYTVTAVSETPTIPQSISPRVSSTTVSDADPTLDTDLDGVADITDVDDDNDGILDTDENQLVNLISDGGFVNNTASSEFSFAANATVGGTSFSPALTGGLFEETGSIDGPSSINVATNGTDPAVTIDLGQLDDNTIFQVAFDVQSNSSAPVTGPLLVTVFNRTTDMLVEVIFNQSLNGFAPINNPQTVSGSFYIPEGSTDEFELRFHGLGNGTQPADYRLDRIVVATTISDFDLDGIINSLDIDSDNDGITDNIEAQATNDFIAPSGVAGTLGFTDVNMDGLDDVFDNHNADNGNTLDADSAAATSTQTLIDPVDTDNDNNPDFLDMDSDNQGGSDTAEAGLTGSATGLSNATTDVDGDGLFDVFDGQNGTDINDGFDVNESIATGAAALLDTDNDAAGNVPLEQDVNFRDAQTIDLAPEIDLDFLTDPNIEPDESAGIIPLVFSNPTTINDGGTVENDGEDGAERATYSSVATVNGVTIDLIATVLETSGNSNPTFNVIDGNANANIPGDSNSVLVRYELVDQATGNPVPLNFTTLIGDLDANNSGSQERVTINVNEFDAFILEGGANPDLNDDNN